MSVFRRTAELVGQIAKSRAENKLRRLYADTHANGHKGGPYPFQVDFHAAGADHAERAIIAGNRTGKTRAAAAETAIHAIGWYPPWWTGWRCDEPINAIVAEPTNQLLRDIAQDELLGGLREGEREPRGTGWIPRSALVEWKFRQCGVADVLDYVKVRHASGGASTISFLSYEQGDVKFQGTSRHLCWLDEEPESQGMKIYSEAVTRLLDKRGRLVLTRTPLFGASEIIQHFLDGGEGIWHINAEWSDAPHLDPAERARLLQSYPEHERDARSKGVPMLGSGGVYPVPDETIACDPFPIPDHFRRVCGIDFGIGHPGANVWIAHDGDRDIVYVYDAHRASGETAAYHAAAIRSRGTWIPVAWPHDGINRDKGTGLQLSEMYANAGANMLPVSARFEDDKGGPQSRERSSMEILERMRTGRFKVFRHLDEWFREKRMLHRKDGVIVPINDDLESATRYALMMLRFAVTGAEAEWDAPHGSGGGRSRAGGDDCGWRHYDPLESGATR